MSVDPLFIVVAFLVKSASSWLPAIGETFRSTEIEAGKNWLTGWFVRWRKKRQEVRHLQYALEKAAHRGISAYQGLAERDQYRDILSVLSQEGFRSEEL